MNEWVYIINIQKVFCYVSVTAIDICRLVIYLSYVNFLLLLCE
jgi:hypothetical protein